MRKYRERRSNDRHRLLTCLAIDLFTKSEPRQRSSNGRCGGGNKGRHRPLFLALAI